MSTTFHPAAVPRLYLANGFLTDFSATAGANYVLLSAPRIQVRARASRASLVVPRPQIVHTTVWTIAEWHIQEKEANCSILFRARMLSFRVWCTDGRQYQRDGAWTEWRRPGVKAYMKAATFYVRAHGWETNVTRVRVRPRLSPRPKWRLDVRVRPLLEGWSALHGRASTTCAPSGLLGHAWITPLEKNGAVDDYGERNGPRGFAPIRTMAQGEGALRQPADTYRFNASSRCEHTQGAVRYVQTVRDIGFY